MEVQVHFQWRKEIILNVILMKFTSCKVFMQYMLYFCLKCLLGPAGCRNFSATTVEHVAYASGFTVGFSTALLSLRVNTYTHSTQP